MDKVHAPFNFVPLSSKVFYPDWSDKISQDIPFKDGVSGYISLTIKAKSPIFVRDGHTKDEGDKLKENGEYETAAKLPDGRFYLPATSVKGCVRNVLEILGNCKMTVDKNAKFAKIDVTPAELEKKRQGDSSERPDLAECIFGYTGKEKSLRGRVQFSNFISEDAEEEEITEKDNFIRILNGPKASYYPIYIKQELHNGKVARDYKTYNDGQLAGWKRYHVRDKDNIWKKCVGKDKLDTKFKPLKAGAKFEGKIYFHNLLPQELGALLSAIKFHNTEGCYHQIGKAKPYGFGVVEINVDEIDLNGEKLQMDDEPINRCMIAFEDLVYSDEWKNIADELVTLSTTLVKNDHQSKPAPNRKPGQYEYMELKDFSHAKNEKAALRPFSSIVRKKSVNDSYRRKKEELRRKAEAERQKAERLSKGLAFLSEKYDDGPNAGKFKVNDFKGIRNRVDRYLKQSGLASVSEEDLPLLCEALERVQAGENKATKGWDEEWIKKVKG